MIERNLDNIVGYNINDVFFPLKITERIRQVKPGQVITETYDGDRLTVEVDFRDIVTRIYWG